MHPYLFAFDPLKWYSGDTGVDLLNGNIDSQLWFRTRINELWAEQIGTNIGIWPIIVKLAGLIALVMLAWSMMSLVKKIADNGDIFDEMDKFVWILLIVILLLDTGAGVATLAKAQRDIVLGLDRNIAEQLKLSAVLSQQYDKTFGEVQGNKVFNDASIECQDLLLVKEEYQTCLTDYLKVEQGKIAGDSKQKSVFDKIGEVIAGIGNGTLEIAEYTTSSVAFTNERIKLYIAGIAFTLAADIAMFVMALFGPMAASASLMPVGAKAIFAWITGFYSIGATKISYTLIIGLMASIITGGDGIGDSILAYMVGKVVPIIAIALGTGGGIALFSSLSSLGLQAGKGGGNFTRSIGGAAMKSFKGGK